MVEWQIVMAVGENDGYDAILHKMFNNNCMCYLHGIPKYAHG